MHNRLRIGYTDLTRGESPSQCSACLFELNCLTVRTRRETYLLCAAGQVGLSGALEKT